MFVGGVVEVLEILRPFVAKLGTEPVGGDEALELVDLGIELERLGAAVRIIAARSVDSDRWKAAGFRSAASWMAARAGLPVGPSIAAMQTLRLLDELPATAEAFRSGCLSLAQVNAIVDVASEWPATEQRLLDAAEVMSLGELREECRRVKAAAVTDEDEWYRRLRKGRYFRSWTDRDGAVRLSARLTPDGAARLLAEVDTRCGEIEGDARAGGWYEGHDAHRADALVDLAHTAGGAGQSGGPEAVIHVMVDYEALARGQNGDGGRCEIPGIGPIPVSSHGLRRHPQGDPHQWRRDRRRGPCRSQRQSPPAHRSGGPRSQMHRPGMRDAAGAADRPLRALRRDALHERRGLGSPLQMASLPEVALRVHLSRGPRHLGMDPA